MNLNQIHLIGRVGQDPEIKALPSGAKVASFSLATNRTWSQDGEKKEQTEWHNIVFFGDNLIEKVISPYVQRGSEIYVGGRVQTRSWEKDGVKHYRTEVVGETIQLGQRGNAGEGGGTRPAARAGTRPPRTHEEEQEQGGYSDDDFADAPVHDPSATVQRAVTKKGRASSTVAGDEEIRPEDIPF